MKLVYGSFQFFPGEITSVSIHRELGLSPRNNSFTERRTIRASGIVIASGQAAIQARANAITAGLALNGAGDVALLADDSSYTEISLDNATSFTGVRVTRRPSFAVDGSKAHFVTGLPFAMEFSAEYIRDVTADPYLEYKETITVHGDGTAISVVRPVDFGRWQRQQVTTTTPRIIIQQGSAIGKVEWAGIGAGIGHPVYPAPIYPLLILNPLQDREIAETGPQANGSALFGFGLTWRYVMTDLDGSAIPHPSYV